MTTDLPGVADRQLFDTHAHQPTSEFLHDAGGEMMQDAADRFGTDLETWDYEEMLAEYHEAGVGGAVLLGWDAETNTGNPPVPNDYVAEVRDEYSDFFVGFGSVDPLKDDCVQEAIRCVEDLDLSGFKFQQIAQALTPRTNATTTCGVPSKTSASPSSFTAATRRSGPVAPAAVA